jgi:hypothetical protein
VGETGTKGHYPSREQSNPACLEVELVERMLKLYKDLPKAKTAHEKTAIERQIQATDKQIDLLVYELYGLMEEEIRIVEGGKE